MADKPSAPLSGDLLARKGAATADGFAAHAPSSIRARTTSSYRWRVALFSTTLAVSVAVISFVGGALYFGVPGRPAPESVADAVPPPPPPAAIEPASVAAAPSAKSLAVAVADDLARRSGDKIARTPESQPENVTTAPPPSPGKRPDRQARAAYRVQLHALGSDAAVRREWRRLRGRHGALFSGLKLTVAPRRVGAGDRKVYRLQLGALASRTQARALCKKLRRENLRCIVVR